VGRILYITYALSLPISYSSKMNGYLSSEGFSTLEKNALICYQRAMLPIQSGVSALWQFGALFV
jgi:hypothetical protein